MAQSSAVPSPWRTTPGRQPEELWGADAAARRSSELTPLFVHRFAGVHRARSESFHDCWELIYVFRGQGILHAGAPYPFKAGWAYLLPPRQLHREESRESMDTFWTGLTGRRLEGQEELGVRFCPCEPLGPLIEQLWLCAERPFAVSGPELDGLAQAALGRFLRIHTAERSPAHDLLDEAIERLHRDFQLHICVADLAAQMGFSEGYFFRAFKRRTGMTPVQYLTRLRIDHALKLLQHSSLSVSRVARLVGYNDPLYFSRIFKKLTGARPSGRTRKGL